MRSQALENDTNILLEVEMARIPRGNDARCARQCELVSGFRTHALTGLKEEVEQPSQFGDYKAQADELSKMKRG